jgi:LPS-assembly protein
VFGRRWRSEIDPNFGPATNMDDHASDYVGAISGDTTHLGGSIRFRLDDSNFALRRFDAGVRANLWRVSASLRYYDISDDLAGGDPSQEISGTLGFRVTKHWNFSYGLRRDLDSNINLSQDLHVLYRDDCMFVDFTYSRTETIDRTLGPSEGFHVRIGLSTLGMFGS